MGLISDLTPVNYSSEKKRFLANPTFNPRFEYNKEFEREELVKFGLPNSKYLKLAQEIVDKALKDFTPEELIENRGEILSEQAVEEAIKDFLGDHQLETRFQIIWSKDFVSRASATSNTIKLRRPCIIRGNELNGLIYHEIGTHALRRINYEKQPWFKKKKKFGFKSYLKTEEGLATLHSLLERKHPFAYTAAVNYLAVHKAQTSSFLEVYNFLLKYLSKPEKTFNITFRKKRGLADTSYPGGFTKDLVYFEGFIDVVQFLIKKNFPLEELYFGKMAWQDVIKAVGMNSKFKPLMPYFYTRDIEKYQSRVKEIAEVNCL